MTTMALFYVVDEPTATALRDMTAGTSYNVSPDLVTNPTSQYFGQYVVNAPIRQNPKYSSVWAIIDGWAPPVEIDMDTLWLSEDV